MCTKPRDGADCHHNMRTELRDGADDYYNMRTKPRDGADDYQAELLLYFTGNNGS